MAYITVYRKKKIIIINNFTRYFSPFCASSVSRPSPPPRSSSKNPLRSSLTGAGPVTRPCKLLHGSFKSAAAAATATALNQDHFYLCVVGITSPLVARDFASSSFLFFFFHSPSTTPPRRSLTVFARTDPETRNAAVTRRVKTKTVYERSVKKKKKPPETRRPQKRGIIIIAYVRPRISSSFFSRVRSGRPFLFQLYKIDRARVVAFIVSDSTTLK